MTESRYRFFVLVMATILMLGAVAYWARDILSPFIVAFILAHLCNPLVYRLEGYGLSRPWAAFTVTAVLILIFCGLVVILGPLLYEQLISLLKALPNIFDNIVTNIKQHVLPLVPWPFRSRLGDLVSPDVDSLGNLAGPFASSLISGGAAILVGIGLAVLTPVILYYLMKEWPAMMAGIFSLIPTRSQAAAHDIAGSIDDVLSGFLRGQAWVCVTMAFFYSIGLTITGLEYGLLIGILSGFLKYLPYIGTAIGIILAVSTSLTQGDWGLSLMLGIVITYGLGEILESSYLIPKLVGTRVKLSPTVVIFAVLLGGKLLGVIGVFIAAPVFAICRILIRHFLYDEETPSISSTR